MKFNKETQYAILLAIYLGRSGRTALKNVAASLDLSEDMLYNVARKLTKAKIIKSTKAPGGGSELLGDPTVLSIVKAIVGPTWLTTGAETYQLGSVEGRAFAVFSNSARTIFKQALNVPVRSLEKTLVTNEVKRLDDVVNTSLES